MFGCIASDAKLRLGSELNLQYIMKKKFDILKVITLDYESHL